MDNKLDYILSGYITGIGDTSFEWKIFIVEAILSRVNIIFRL